MKSLLKLFLKKKRKFSDSALLIILLYGILFFFIYQKKDDNWKHIINSDGKGYYLYLPTAIIYHDFSYSFIEKLNYDATITFNFVDGKKINRYFSGTAVLMLPFFMAGILFSFLFHFPIDGYSLPFQIAIYCSSFFYALTGFYFLRKLLEKYRFGDKAIGLTILLYFLATNLINYSLLEPAFSHVYSFTLVCMFCYYAKCLSESHDNVTLGKISLVFGLILLTRPVNGTIVLCFPFFFQNPKQFLVYTLKNIIKNKYILVCALIIISLLTVQLIMYYLQTGKFFIYAYDDAHLDLGNPHVKDVLWGYTKGLFVYTPLTFISLAGFLVLFRLNKFQAAYLLLFLYGIVYLVSSWSSWTYGYSFGMRAMIDFFPFFALLLAFALQAAGRVTKLFIMGIGFLFILINHIQNYQYLRLILDGQSASYFRYWRIFLRTSPDLSDKWSKVFLEHYQQKPNTEIKSFLNDFDADVDWGHQNTYCHNPVYSGKKSCKIIAPLVYSPGLAFLYRDGANGEKIYIRVSAQALLPDLNCMPELIISIENDSGIYYLTSFPLFFHVEKINSWSPVLCGVNLPFPPKSENDLIKVYFFNNSKIPFYFDDMQIEVIPVINKPD